MRRQNVDSSNLSSIGYDDETETLEVEFKDRSIYQYYGVPKLLYTGLMSADSHGKFLNEKIKRGGFRYSKV